MAPEGQEVAIGRNSFKPIEHGTRNIAQWLGELTHAVGIHPPQFTHGGILYWTGITTTELTDTQSIPLRHARAEAFYGIQNTRLPIEQRRAIFAQEKDRKRITHELYAHHLVEVDTSFGRIGGQVSILNPHAEGKPIVVVPGSSNDPESMESGLVSLALVTGSRILVLGYPCAPNGKITPAFHDAVIAETKRAQESFRQPGQKGTPPTYAPYVEFFDALLKHPDIVKTLAEDQQFDLWAYSGGAAISAKLLTQKPEYRDRIENAVFLNPAGSATFSVSSDKEFEQHMAKQGRLTLAEKRDYFHYTWWDDPRKIGKNEDKRLKFETWQALGRGTHYRIPDWNSVQTKGNIIVYSGGSDYATMSFLTFQDKVFPGNDNIHVYYDPLAHHVTLLTHPDGTIRDIIHFQKSLDQTPEIP